MQIPSSLPRLKGFLFTREIVAYAIRVNIRSDGAVSNKAVFVALAILPDGTRDVSGLWFQANEGARFRAKVLNDLRNPIVGETIPRIVS
jgi:putative transposase